MSSIKPEDYTIVAEVKEFSNVDIHSPWNGELSKKFINLTVKGYHTDMSALCDPEVRANGHNLSTEGFVSISFKDLFLNYWDEVTIVISVIDIDGNCRFPQSFLLPTDNDTIVELSFRINFIPRSVLLNEPSELLPNDTLTLCMDFAFQHINVDTLEFSEFPFKVEEGPGGSSFFLCLDSPFAQQLREESVFFEQMSATPMTEGISRWMKISDEELFVDLEMIRSIFCGTCFLNLTKAFQVFATAHMYRIEKIMKVCRRFLQLHLSPENVCEISNFAEKYQDSHLKEIVETFRQQIFEKQTESFLSNEMKSFILNETRDSYDFYK